MRRETTGRTSWITVALAILVATPAAALVLNDGDYVVVDYQGKELYRIDPDGCEQEELACAIDKIETLGTFADPRGVAFDGDGSLLVADRGEPGGNDGVIWRVDPTTGVQHALLPPPGEASLLEDPISVVLGPDEELYVGDEGGRIVKLRATQGFEEDVGIRIYYTQEQVPFVSSIAFLPAPFQPRSMAFDANGDLWVADTFDAQSPPGKGQLSEGNVYWIDLPDGTVNRISGGFDHPVGIAIDHRGDVVVTDAGDQQANAIVYRFTPGTPLTQGTHCSATTLTPRTSVLLDSGRIVATRGGDGGPVDFEGGVMIMPADGGSSCNQRGIRQPDNPRNDIGPPYDFQFWGIAVFSEFGTQGLLAPVTDQGVGGVRRVSAGGVVSSLPCAFDEPTDVAVDSTGGVLVADKSSQDQNPGVWRIAAQAEPELQCELLAQPGEVPDGSGDCIVEPESVTVRENGDVLVLDFLSGCGDVYRVEPDGVMDGEIDDVTEDPTACSGQELVRPVDLSFLNDQVFYVLDLEANGGAPGVVRVELGSTITQQLVVTSGLVEPTRLTVDIDGTLFITDLQGDFGSPAILEVPPGGSTATVFRGLSDLLGVPPRDIGFGGAFSDSRALLATNDDEVFEVSEIDTVYAHGDTGARRVAIDAGLGASAGVDNCGDVILLGTNYNNVPGFVTVDRLGDYALEFITEPQILCTYFTYNGKLGYVPQIRKHYGGFALSDPTDIAVRGEQNYVVSDAGADDLFEVVGTAPTPSSLGVSSILLDPQAVAWRQGSSYVADPELGTIVRVPDAGGSGSLLCGEEFELAAGGNAPGAEAVMLTEGKRESGSGSELEAALADESGVVQLAMASSASGVASLSLDGRGPREAAKTESDEATARLPDGIHCDPRTQYLFTAAGAQLAVNRGSCQGPATEVLFRGTPGQNTLLFIDTNAVGDVFVTDLSAGKIWVARWNGDGWNPVEDFFPGAPAGFAPLALCVHDTGEVNVSDSSLVASGGSVRILQINRAGSAFATLVDTLNVTGGIACAAGPLVGGAVQRRLSDIDVHPSQPDPPGVCPRGDELVTADDARVALQVALGLIPTFSCPERTVDSLRLDLAPPETVDPLAIPPTVTPGGDAEVTASDALLIYRAGLGLIDVPLDR